jgi:ribosomal protein L37E
MARPGVTATTPWAPRRRLAEVVRVGYAVAEVVLTLNLALLELWEEAWLHAREEPPEVGELAGWATARVLPRIVEATAKAGPEPLAAATHTLLGEGTASEGEGTASEPLVAWLAGGELSPVQRYLARASLRAPLEALGAAPARDPSPGKDRRCPHCGGPPQLSFRAHSDDALVSGHRHLLCARCGASWSFAASACASCGETAGARRTVYAEQREQPVVGRGDLGASGQAGALMFPHLRIEGCESCSRYLIDVDLSRDPRAVPEVDELAALPLDLYAAERGLTKITPNLMGF